MLRGNFQRAGKIDPLRIDDAAMRAGGNACNLTFKIEFFFEPVFLAH